MRISDYNDLPKWLGEQLLTNSLPWRDAQKVSLPKFLLEYTLHDSSWIDLLVEAWRQEILAVFSWDTCWTKGRVPYPPEQFLFVSFARVYQITLSGSKGDCMNTISSATSRLVENQEREVLFEQLMRQTTNESGLDVFLDDTLYYTEIEDVLRNQVGILHNADTFLLCLGQDGQVLPIPDL